VPSHWILEFAMDFKVVACLLLLVFFLDLVVPFFGTLNLKIIPKNTMNAHLSRFKLMPYSLHFWKHNMNFYRWLSMSLYTIKSSKNIFIELSKYSLNALVIVFWYVRGPFLTPNSITFHTKVPPVYNTCSVIFMLQSYRDLMISWIFI